MTNEVEELVERVDELRRSRNRVLIGIVGEPGSGKSTVSAAILEVLGVDGVVVPMDGFHLAGRELERLDRSGRKGAIDTFDGWGYVQLIKRLRVADEDVVYAPDYVRGLEESIAGSIAIPGSVPVVISEGNYLLDAGPPWNELRALFDEVWYVEAPQQLRIERLVQRHVRFGMAEAAARTWASDVDEVNAKRVRAACGRADVVIDVATLDVGGTD